MSKTRKKKKEIIIDRNAKKITNRKVRQGWRQKQDDSDAVSVKKLAGKHYGFWQGGVFMGRKKGGC